MYITQRYLRLPYPEKTRERVTTEQNSVSGRATRAHRHLLQVLGAYS